VAMGAALAARPTAGSDTRASACRARREYTVALELDPEGARPTRRARGEPMATKIAEGKRAPDFTLEDANGKRVSLADFKGKDVIVYFYPKDDTPGCTKEAC